MNFDAQDKYKKMLRAYERLRVINTDTGNQHGNTEAIDATEDFFNQCYHLKDWLRNIIPLTNIEIYIKDSEYLSIADIYCNTFKHAGPDRNLKPNKIIGQINTHVRFNLTNNGFVASSKLEISIGENKYNSLMLAENCIKEWNIFLNQNNLKFIS